MTMAEQITRKLEHDFAKGSGIKKALALWMWGRVTPGLEASLRGPLCLGPLSYRAYGPSTIPRRPEAEALVKELRQILQEHNEYVRHMVFETRKRVA
jgi:hypothetical protein